MSSHDIRFMLVALQEAHQYIGATAPNPPVGACVVKDEKILATAAHEKAGTEHAEAAAIRKAIEIHGQASIEGATLFVTLEPCNHFGKTPPCTERIIQSGISKVVYGVADPNKTSASGVERLKSASIKIETGICADACAQLINPFRKFILTKKPWVVHKLAYRYADKSLILTPPNGKTTFTSEESLKTAHLERKHSDAILTSVETVIADKPLFTVRKIQDHFEKNRYLAVLSKKGQPAPAEWIERQSKLGFNVISYTDIKEALVDLGSKGVLQVLVEAGPRLSAVIIEEKLWDERLVFISGLQTEDICFREKATRGNS